MVTIQISPEFESTVAIYPRYSIIYLQFTTRETVTSSGYQFPKGFSAGQLVGIDSVDRYRLIQNCVDSAPRVLKESLTPTNVKVDFNELKQDDISSCYYSLVYTKDNKPSRHAFVVNVYNSEHSPLKPNVQIRKSTVYVTSDSNTYLCSIGDKHKNGNKCQEKLNKLSDPYVIQVHTNKRSYYEMRKK